MYKKFALAGMFMVSMLVTDTFAECPEEYSKLASNHVRCRQPKGTEIPLTQADKDEIVLMSNKLRSEVEPPAANMLKLKWNEEMAQTAALLARGCEKHMPPWGERAEPSLPGVNMGGLIEAGAATVQKAISEWSKQAENFEYGVETHGLVIQYLEMVSARRSLVGCGIANCSGLLAEGTVVVCQYAPSYMPEPQYMFMPYDKSNVSCSACPDKCDSSEKLCDCNGKVCVNEGRFNIADCSCKCNIDKFEGDRCEKKICKDTISTCESVLKNWPDVCEKFSNFKEEQCCSTCEKEKEDNTP